MKEKILAWLWCRLAPWYREQLLGEVCKLPHEVKCTSRRGPYQCDCAKRRISSLLLKTIKDEEKLI